MKLRFAATAFLCLAVCTLAAQQAGTSQKASRGITASASSSTNGQPKRNIFDVGTSSDSDKTAASSASTKNGAVSSGRTTVSPFGTTSPRTKTASRQRWKTASKIADCIREKAVPANTNFSFSGTVTGIATDGRFTILTMFDSVETVAENGARGDVPVTFTVVMDVDFAASASIKVNSKKSFTVDSNYVYFMWDDAGCTVRVVHNSLTEPDQASTTSKR